MGRAMIGLLGLAAMTMSGTALAQPATSGPQPNRQTQQGTGLFPGNQPVPMYSSSANNAGASLQAQGGNAPNAGVTGYTGSGGNGRGWNAPAYSPPQTRR